MTRSLSKIAAVFLSLSVFPQIVLGETKDLDSVMKKATPAESRDIAKLMQQLSIVPDSGSGDNAYKVKLVDKGSLWDREGIKVGDIVLLPKSRNSKTALIEVNTHLKYRDSDKTLRISHKITLDPTKEPLGIYRTLIPSKRGIAVLGRILQEKDDDFQIELLIVDSTQPEAVFAQPVIWVKNGKTTTHEHELVGVKQSQVEISLTRLKSRSPS